MLSAVQFQRAAQDFSATWYQHSPTPYQWGWVDSKSSFSASLGGGYLSMENVPVCAAITTAAATRPSPSSGISTAGSTDMMSNLNAEAHICQADRTVAAVGTLQQHQESDSSHSMCDEDDKECMATDSDQAVYFYNYHIVYLPSYNVPVLLFNGRCADGSLLLWDSIVANLPPFYQCIARQPNAKWTFISQIDHPHLHMPWYMLHPCQTAELLQLMMQADAAATDAQAIKYGIESAHGVQYMKAWFSLVGPVVRLQLKI